MKTNIMPDKLEKSMDYTKNDYNVQIRLFPAFKTQPGTGSST